MPNRPVIKVIQNRDFIALPMDTSVLAAAKLMKQRHQGSALIVGEGRLLGICTERDLVFDVLAEGLDPTQTPISEVMTANPETIGPEQPFSHALHLMFEGGFRHMPVLDAQGQPLGIISARDALGLETAQFNEELERREALTELL